MKPDQIFPRRAFTLIELLVVITVIAILAGLVLSTAGYVQKKSARSRAEAEIAALSAALESYKVEYGAYPSNSAAGSNGSLVLYKALAYSNADLNPNGKIFMEPTRSMLAGTNAISTTYFVDPFGNAYEYRTGSNATNNGSNFFDLWSLAGAKPSTDTNQWIKNW
jgi:prepilin-type N-terminal cleavage/methylation domain-containing protein